MHDFETFFKIREGFLKMRVFKDHCHQFKLYKSFSTFLGPAVENNKNEYNPWGRAWFKVVVEGASFVINPEHKLTFI